MATITPERDLEEALVTKLRGLKYEYRPDIRDRATLERNFREKFEELNRVTPHRRRVLSAYSMRSSRPMSSLPPAPFASETASPAMTARR